MDVATGASTPISIKMGVAGTQETVNVTAATPIIDTKKETTTTNVTLEELQNIPSARDPWVVMQTVPTIYVDRVNVGGSESGQQSNYIGKGSYGTDNTWNLDGVPITDMGATGSTPTYYDFDMFQEMAVTTGGADAANPTPGVQLNLILKKGSNTPHGDAQRYWEGQSLQSDEPAGRASRPPSAARAARATAPTSTTTTASTSADRSSRIACGPGAASAGPTFSNITLTGSPDETFLKNYAFKGDAQLNNNIRGNFTFFEGNKIKNGRSVGPTRPPETGWNQTGPTKMYKGEGNFVVGQSLFASARYAYISGGFQLAPAGGLNTNMYQDDNGVWHGSYYLYKTDRPQDLRRRRRQLLQGQPRGEVRLLLAQDAGDSLTQHPAGNHIVTFYDGYPNMQAQVTQDYHRQHRRQVHQRVRDRHDLDEPSHGHRRRAVRPPDLVAHRSRRRRPSRARRCCRRRRSPAVNNAYDFNTMRRASGSPTRSTTRARRSCGRAMRSSRRSCRRTPASLISPAQYSYATYSAVDTQPQRRGRCERARRADLDLRLRSEQPGRAVARPTRSATSARRGRRKRSSASIVK